MKIGIIGAPQSGKTTAFKILLQESISGDIGIFKIQDPRVEKIARLFSSRKTNYPQFTLMDIGSLSELNKKSIARLQDIDLFICVVGAFFCAEPRKEFESIVTDIILLDLEVIQNRIARVEREAKAVDGEQELNILKKCQLFLTEGKPLYNIGLEEYEIKKLSGFLLLSLKPLILAINLPEDITLDLKEKLETLTEYCSSLNIPHIRFFGKIESELIEIAPEEREKFSKALGGEYRFREEMSRLISKELNLVTFFTAGEKEARGWYLKSGLPVIEAAGKIHSDMRRGFIRAEVVSYEDLVKYGSIHKAREAGTLKLEGKDYIVRDGDIINVRFNV